jgi:hypothetical protein
MLVPNTNHSRGKDKLASLEFMNNEYKPMTQNDVVEMMVARLPISVTPKSPSKYAKLNATGDTTKRERSDIYDVIGGKLVKAAVGILAHKAEEYLVAAGLFAKANTITDRQIITAVEASFEYHLRFRKLKGYTIDFMLGENRSEYAKIVLHLVKQFVNIFNTVDRKLDTELEVAGTWNNMTFAGTADLIEYHDNGDITIWDIKHYNSISDKDFNMFDIQTDIYASLFEDTTGNTVTHTGIILPIQGRLERKRN